LQGKFDKNRIHFDISLSRTTPALAPAMKFLRHLLFWCVLLLIGALLAQWWLSSSDAEQVLLRYDGYDVLFTPLSALALLALAMLAVWLLWQVLLLPLRWRECRKRRRGRQLNDGLHALHLGQYAQAERQLAALASTPELALVACLGAARAAQARGEMAAARTHLTKLASRHPGTHAIALAELELAEQRPEDALAALDAPAAQPLPPRGLALRADALAASGKSLAAYALIDSLRKQAVWPLAELQRREQAWAAAALDEAVDGDTLSAAWERLSTPLRRQPELRATYTARAAALGLPLAHEQRDANGLPRLLA